MTTVAVITATIGRDSLLRTIKSVQEQTYPCTHYIFVDGKEHHKAVTNLLKKHKFRNVEIIYLPANTGANGMYNSNINAAAAFLVPEDVICYLDDDNWFEPNHVANAVHTLKNYDVQYAYGLRYFAIHHDDGTFSSHEDHNESLGFWTLGREFNTTFHVELQGQPRHISLDVIRSFNYPYLIDVNCFALTRPLAQQLAPIWSLKGLGNDRIITEYLLENKVPGACTGEFSVHYLADIARQHALRPEFYDDVLSDVKDTLSEADKRKISEDVFLASNDKVRQNQLEHYGYIPWQRLTLCIDDKLITPQAQNNPS